MVVTLWAKQTHQGAVMAQPVALESHIAAVVTHSEALEVYPGDMESKQEQWLSQGAVVAPSWAIVTHPWAIMAYT